MPNDTTLSIVVKLRNEASAGAADEGVFGFGGAGWAPVVGDWSGSGKTGIGAIAPTGVWYVRNDPSAGAADAGVFSYGLPGWTGLAGGIQANQDSVMQELAHALLLSGADDK